MNFLLTANLTTKTASNGSGDWTPPAFTFGEQITIALRLTKNSGGAVIENDPPAHKQQRRRRGRYQNGKRDVDRPIPPPHEQFLPGHEPFPGSAPTPIGPFAHLGFELAERSDIDRLGPRAGRLRGGQSRLPNA